MTEKLDGLCIPAHVDRTSYSIISNLGFIPPSLKVPVVEFSKKEKPENIIEKNPFLKNYKHIVSSDAHYLWDISEREHFIKMEYLSINQLFISLKS